MKLLIVEDEEGLLEMLRLRLAASGGYRIDTAADGAEGLRKAFSCRPDAVLLDLAMPGMTGWELCRRLSGDPRTRRARLIIMTALLTEDVRRRAIHAGAARVLLKPFGDEELDAALQAPGGVAV